MKSKEHLIGSLAYWVAAGKLEGSSVLPGISKLTEGEQKTLPALLEDLAGEGDENLVALAIYLRQTLRREAFRIRDGRRRKLPVAAPEGLIGFSQSAVEEWKLAEDPESSLERALRMSRELVFLAANQDKAPRLFSEVRQQSSRALALAGEAMMLVIERLPGPVLNELASAWDLPGRETVLARIEARRREFRERWQEQVSRVLFLDAGAGAGPGQQTGSAVGAAELGGLEEIAIAGTLAQRFAAAGTRDEQERLLDLACSWMTPAVAPAIAAMTSQPWAQERATWNLTLRFGRADLESWGSWQRWLNSQEQLWDSEQKVFHSLVQREAAGLLLVLYSQEPDPDPALLDELSGRVAALGGPVDVQRLISSWATVTPIHERRALLGDGEARPPLIRSVAPAVSAAATLTVREAPPVISESAPSFEPPRPPPVPAAPPKPSIWEAHIQPFFVENWYIVAGIAMVILGSSLLAYYTWDKHWLVRYTIMPLLLGGFTWLLARVGSWIEKKSDEFKGTAAIMRGAAIGLLPINFMAMALLSADQQVPQKVPALLVMALIYFSAYGWGLRKWCGAVERSLGNFLGGTLLLLNALVAVGPLARTMGHLEGKPLVYCLVAAFYIGFAATAGAIVHFTRRILTREMAEEKRVPWFVAGALSVTFIEVFIWVHGFMRYLPQAPTYALLVILTGWLILFAERRALELRASPQLHGGESFLGFGAILLGLLMGFSDPIVRILCFAMAGGIWLYQALWRRHALHYWIALTLFGLGGAAIGLLPQYPGPWLPLLGIAMALLFGLGSWISERSIPRTEAPVGSREADAIGNVSANRELAQACRGMQMVALVVTAIVAPLVQWHYASPPLGTAGCLVLVAGLCIWRAFHARPAMADLGSDGVGSGRGGDSSADGEVHWLHAAMAILALALPYAGFMDVAGRSAHNNTMVFGLALLSWLWLGAAWITRKPLILEARSTVLWLYGTLGVAAMLLRVALGDTSSELLGFGNFMDYSGPLLMMLALIPAAYFSRSLVPAGMAVAIMVILYPELKASLEQMTPWLAWGTGLSSSLWGLGLAGLCFVLRPWAFLRDLPGGDRFLGREPFPFRRQDHTLFTWPIMAAAIYLLAKVDTWHVIRNLSGGLLPFKTALALGVTGVAWTIVAIYHRAQRSAVAAVHLGWLCAAAGITFGYWRQAAEPHWEWPALVTGVLLQGLYWFYRYGLEPKRPWVRALLSEPMRLVLLAGSAGLSVACMASLLDGASLEEMRWLYVFLAAQLVWHALRTRHWVWGTILFFHVWIGLLAATAPGIGALWDRVSIEASLSPTLWLLVGIQLLLIALELRRKRPASAGELPEAAPSFSIADFLAPVWTPLLVLATCLAALLGLSGLFDGVHVLSLSAGQQVLLLATLLLAARGQASNLILLPAIFLAYLIIHRGALAQLGSVDRQLELLATPWRLSLLGLAMVLLTQGGRLLHQRAPRLLAGQLALPVFTARSCGWLFWPGTMLCAVAALYHTALPALRASPVQLWSPYIGAATFALVAWFWRQGGFFAGAGTLLVLGNVHLVRVFAGEFLRAHGLSELHLLCLGLGLTLVQASAVLRALRSSSAIALVNRASLGLAGAILALLSANYFTEPNLEAITSLRFVVSGVLAWLAGQYFRRASRHPGPGEEAHTDLCEALYHFGVVVAFWCAALLVPWFRQPLFALVALGLPVAYFYARAEFGMKQGRAEARRYRNSAAALGFAILGLYLFKGIFHLVLFPGTPVSTQHYHYNAPLILLLGLVLLRLHGLGGTSWLAFYGGLALMTGSYFLLTALPGLSPFEYPMPSAWCALGLGHFWILLSYERSPVRTFIQRIARLTDESWDSLRRSWGRCLLAATQGAVGLSLLDWESNTLMVAPLIAGAATIFLHQGILRRSPAYLVAAGLEFAAALHMDFLMPSYLPKEQIIWVILGLWLAMLVVFEVGRGKLRKAERFQGLSTETPGPGLTSASGQVVKTELAVPIGQIAAVLGLLVLAHVFYHRPWMPVGLWGMGMAALLAAWTPAGRSGTARFCGALLLGVPVWLVYFSQAPFMSEGLGAALEPWPILGATAALFLVGLAGRLFPTHWATAYHSKPRIQVRLFDLTLDRLESDGAWIYRGALSIATAIVCAVQVLHYREAFAAREFTLLVLLEAALAVAWFFEGRDRRSMAANYLMQLCAAACFASVRRHLMLTTGWWNYEYDVWASLAFSFGIAGTRQLLDAQSRTLRIPLLTTLFTLPVVALVWVVVHGLGVNLALVVIGLHSVLFAFLGKDNRESPYNIVALAGFVAFILLTFYTKLQFRAVHAYIIPVGLGVLVLQELFKQRIQPDAQNWIRLVNLMAMLGSSGYYALADPNHAIAFNLTMIVLCLLAMGLGSVLRIRLYLVLGFAGLMVDLVSLLYKVLVLMERSARMTVVGTLVLLIGAGLVFGAIYYKTNKGTIEAIINRWRLKLAEWR